MKLRFTGIALHDLRRLRAFIAKKDPAAAQRYSQALRLSLKQLEAQPHLGRVLDESRSVRELIAGDYVARYQVTEYYVTVISVRHHKEN